jgi:predicted 3-demethylubiquinone-9 3-methyltransferase (glyoxalase superfamily)
MANITTFLTFKKDGKQAVEFYCSIFKDSKIHHALTMPGTDQLLHASFELNGKEFMAMDGGDHFTLEDGMSLFVDCKDQAEVDYYWDALTAAGGSPGQCGWLKDRFGVSWQIIPWRLGELMGDPDYKKSGRVMQTMFKMGKIEIAELERAYAGDE